MRTLRMQYQTSCGISERLYPVGADLRCLADALVAIDHGWPVMIEPLGAGSVLQRNEINDKRAGGD